MSQSNICRIHIDDMIVLIVQTAIIFCLVSQGRRLIIGYIALQTQRLHNQQRITGFSHITQEKF